MTADFPHESDPALIEQFRNGSRKAAAVLLARYASLIHHAAAKAEVPGAEQEDLRQEAYMALLAAIRSFDPARGVQFRTYASACVNNALKNLRDASFTQKSRVHLHTVPLDDAADTPTGEQDDPEGRVISRETVETVEHLIDQTLSSYEKEVFYLYLTGCGYDRAAQKLGSTPKSVDNALQRARKKLKAVLNDPD